MLLHPLEAGVAMPTLQPVHSQPRALQAATVSVLLHFNQTQDLPVEDLFELLIAGWADSVPLNF